MKISIKIKIEDSQGSDFDTEKYRATLEREPEENEHAVGFESRVMGMALYGLMKTFKGRSIAAIAFAVDLMREEEGDKAFFEWEHAFCKQAGHVLNEWASHDQRLVDMYLNRRADEATERKGTE